MITDKIYFNHHGFEIASEIEISCLVKELVADIFACTENEVVLSFYKNFSKLSLSFSSESLVDYLFRINDCRTEVCLLFDYISKNSNYPYVTDDSSLLNYQDDFYKWLLGICIADKQKVILSLPNDDLFEHYISINSYKEIINIINRDALLNFLCGMYPKFKSPEHVFEFISKKYKQKIVFLNQARQSLKQISYDLETCNRIYIALFNLIEIVLPSGNKLSKIVADKFKENSGFEISGESRQTMDNRVCKRERTFVINAKEFIFENHVKINDKVRIHYYILDNKIYIGHCGNHLRTSKIS